MRGLPIPSIKELAFHSHLTSRASVVVSMPSHPLPQVVFLQGHPQHRLILAQFSFKSLSLLLLPFLSLFSFVASVHRRLSGAHHLILSWFRSRSPGSISPLCPPRPPVRRGYLVPVSLTESPITEYLQLHCPH